jgi:FkbM family methyltransferase
MRRRRKQFKDIKLSLRVAGFAGLFYAIKGTVMNSEVTLNINRKDVKFPISLRVPSSDIPTYEQVFINQDYDFLVETPPKVIVDAGANIGLASVYFANKYPGAMIIAIEPGNDNFELLKRNVEPYRNIIPVHSALWSKNGVINLIDPGLGSWGFMTEETNASGKTSGKFSHTVKAMTLGKIIADYQLNKIDILKIDIEGAEKEVFEDTSPWIGKVEALIIELHEDMKSGCNRSFYNGSNGFDDEWRRGENVFLAKGKYLTRRLEK